MGWDGSAQFVGIARPATGFPGWTRGGGNGVTQAVAMDGGKGAKV